MIVKFKKIYKITKLRFPLIFLEQATVKLFSRKILLTKQKREPQIHPKISDLFQKATSENINEKNKNKKNIVFAIFKFIIWFFLNS